MDGKVEGEEKAGVLGFFIRPWVPPKSLQSISVGTISASYMEALEQPSRYEKSLDGVLYM